MNSLNGMGISPIVESQIQKYIQKRRIQLVYALQAKPLLAKKGVEMDLLQWALVAFVVAIVAGLFGFTGESQGGAAVGRLLFGLFMAVAAVFLVLALLGVRLLT